MSLKSAKALGSKPPPAEAPHKLLRPSGLVALVLFVGMLVTLLSWEDNGVRRDGARPINFGRRRSAVKI